MRLGGLQKLTLLDFPEHVACTVFTLGCNFRCPYCHNSSLVIPGREHVEGEITEEEFFKFLGKRKGLLDGVAVTGGEPCLHKDLPDFLSRIRDLGFAVKLDTNGNHPGILRQVLDRKLADYVAMDIKNRPEKYAVTIGLKSFDMAGVRESISLLMEGGADYEFRTTVVREFHEAEDFEEIGSMIRGAKAYYLQCFTDRDTVPFGGLHAPSRQELETFAAIASKYVEKAFVRGMD